jgi:hypothetical protein
MKALTAVSPEWVLNQLAGNYPAAYDFMKRCLELQDKMEADRVEEERLSKSRFVQSLKTTLELLEPEVGLPALAEEKLMKMTIEELERWCSEVIRSMTVKGKP